MNWQDLREGYFRVIGLLGRHRHERELSEELEFHMAMKIKGGQSADQAKRDFGGVEKWKEVCRDVGRFRPVEELGRDLLLALRMLRKAPVFTAVALVTLTLAIVANSAIFSLINGLMLKSVAVPNANRLTVLRIQPDDFGYALCYPLFQVMEEHSTGMMRMFAFSDRPVHVRGNEGIETVAGELVSGHYFAALGLKPQLGRWINPHDDRPGTPDGMVVTVSNHFWRSHLGGNPRAVGQQITVDQSLFTVVGVMPEGFRGMGRDKAPEIFIPLRLEPYVDAPFDLLRAGYRAWWLSTGAYLNDGVSLEEANAFLQTNSWHYLDAVAASASFRLNGHKLQELHLIAEPGANGLSNLRLRFRKPLAILMGLVAMVLLIACLNLATLLTMRAASRGHEISTRFVLGASRARLMRQLVTESLLLATVGALMGLAASPILAHSMASMLTPKHGPLSASIDVSRDLSVFAFTALLAVVATVVAGVLPAVRSTGLELHAVMRKGSNSIRGAERNHWWPNLFLAMQVGLSLMLVTGASLLGYSLVKLHQTPMGFEPRGLVYLFTENSKHPLAGPHLLATYKQIVDEIRGLPNVQDASISAGVPLDGSYIAEDIQGVGGSKHQCQDAAVGPNYFKTLQTPLLRGREFRWTDKEESQRKVILNRSAARLLFPKGSALGQRVIFEDGKSQGEVVGVVEDSKSANLRDVAPPIVYSAAMQNLMPGASLDILVRTTGSAIPLIAAASRVLNRVVPDIPAPAAMSMEEAISDSLVTERIMASLALFFGGVALLITGIGLYGTLAYSTERRTGEIGIRLALGAEPRNIISMLCTENGLIAAFGCFVGIVGSAFASNTIASFLYGVSGRDPVILGAPTVTLLGVAAGASLLPGIKAALMDPLTAIRHE